jgi:CRP/FNR family transcriptional regulator, cyclic AMP receptor protein
MEAKSKHSFDAEAFLNSPGVARTLVDYQPAAAIYSQGDPSDTVLYIQHGSVKLSVLSKTGKEAVVGMLGPGDFFGEGALAGQPVRLATRSRVNFFMNKFRKLGFIDYNGGLKVHDALLSVVLHD